MKKLSFLSALSLFLLSACADDICDFQQDRCQDALTTLETSEINGTFFYCNARPGMDFIGGVAEIEVISDFMNIHLYSDTTAWLDTILSFQFDCDLGYECVYQMLSLYDNTDNSFKGEIVIRPEIKNSMYIEFIEFLDCDFSFESSF